MSQFGNVAVLAVELCQRDRLPPRHAWQRAAEQLLSTKSMQDKNCPRTAFLVLCEQGLVTGIPSGEYAPRAKENREQTLNGLRLLANDPSLSADPRGLWKLAVGGDVPDHNDEMDVGVALWKRDLITLSDAN